jgi:hypothetical protein
MRWTIPVLVACSTACAGARTRLYASDAKYVISMSDEVRGADGILIPAARKQGVGTFEKKFTAWSMLFMIIPLSNGTVDLSPDINAQVEKAGGDAVTGLQVTASNCTLSSINLIGIFPDCTDFAVTGNIIRVAAPVSAVTR